MDVIDWLPAGIVIPAGRVTAMFTARHLRNRIADQHVLLPSPYWHSSAS